MFDFGVTLYHGMDKDTIRLPHQFASVVDDRHEQVLLRVRGGAIDMWTTEVLFDCSSMMYLASGWRRFCRVHEIMAGHFLGCVRLVERSGMEWNGSALGIHPRVRLHKKEEWNRSLKPNILPRCGTEWFHRIGGMCSFHPHLISL
jgi:hypothetical protein